MTASYSVYVVPDDTTEGAPCYLAYHPELDGCMSHGATVEEALHGLDEARELYIKTAKELDQPIPTPTEAGTVIVWQNIVPVSELDATCVPTPILPNTELTAIR